MKKHKLFIILLFVVTALFTVGCTTEGEEPSVVVNITTAVKNVAIEDEDFPSYDFTKLFTITENGNVVQTENSYIDLSGVTVSNAGGTVYCNYKEQSASVSVYIVHSLYELTLEESQVTVTSNQAYAYDYSALFTARKNGERCEIDDSMITSNVKNTFGEYSYTVNFHGITKTLTVKVSNNIVITALKTNVQIKDSDVLSYDYKSLFAITKDGLTVNVKDHFLDLTNLSTLGDFTVSCIYEDAILSIDIKVILTDYRVVLTKDEVSIYKGLTDTYDYLRFFKAYVEGRQIEITPDMIDNKVKNVAGSYTYTVKVGSASATLKVNVKDGHDVNAVLSYAEIEIPVTKIADYDYTSLFSLYVDGVAEKVTSDMIDASSLNGAVQGQVYTVKLSYTTKDGITSFTQNASVKVVSKNDVTITSFDKETYPNSAPIDVTTLFEVVDEDGVKLPVKSSMIDGEIDYTKEGVYTLTLDYNGQIATCDVTVKNGVVILADDEIKVKVGTDKKTYLFENDIVLIINGIRLWDYPDAYLDVSEVNFDVLGTYTATFTVPYSINEVSALTKPKFQNYTKTVTYKVVENSYSVGVNEDVVVLDSGTTYYNVFKNLNAVINGKVQTFTSDRTATDAISCYAKLISSPIDYSVYTPQSVIIEVYANGVNNQPEILSYKVKVNSDVKVIAKDRVITVGETLYTVDLFTVTEGGRKVEVTKEMVSGKVDVFNAGIYYVTLNYKDAEEVCKVVVMNNNVFGTYATKLTTTATEDIEDEEGYIEEGERSRVYGNLVISNGFEIMLDGRAGEILSVIDQNTVSVMIGTVKYDLYLFDGVAVLNPENTFKMSFYNGRRPLIYFNKDVWKIDKKVTVNYGNNYVLANSYISYSIDTFKVSSLDGLSEKWYGLKIHLREKNSSDTVYDVEWGEIEFLNGFTATAGESSSLRLNGVDYAFKMASSDTAKVVSNSDNKAFANTSFTGYINGQKHTLQLDYAENVTVSGASLNVKAGMYELSSMPNGGVDHYENTVFIYEYEGNNKDGKYFSHKFNLDLQKGEFTYVEKDSLYGYYEYKNKYIYLDGYGTGHISFNTSTSSESARLKYRQIGGEVELTFVDYSVNFTGGTKAVLYTEKLLNVLTGKYFDDETLVGEKFINKHITDGAIISASVNVICKNSNSTEAKDEVLSGITVTTPKGVWSDSDKHDETKVSFSSVKFSTAGTYRYSITVESQGEKITVYYPLTVLDNVYLENGMVKNYANGVLSSTGSIEFNAYGQAKVIYHGEKFTGKVKIYDNDSYVIRAIGELGTLIVSGEKAHDGIITARASGAMNFTDCFTTGSVNVIAGEDIVLHTVKMGATVISYYSTSPNFLGSEAGIELLTGDNIYQTGATFRVSANGLNTVTVKVVEWGSTVGGLIIADRYIGEYDPENGGDKLVIDGFGKITRNGVVGSYTINARNVVLAKFGEEVVAYKLDLTAMTYKLYDRPLDETLIKGLTFTAEHGFTCGSATFTASTSFIFGDNKTVTVKSTSKDHDSGDSKCKTGDSYSPSYASAKGVTGTYVLQGNTLTVNVNGEEFIFTVPDVVSLSKIVCTSTTVQSTEHGYFGDDTEFYLY